MSMLQKLAMNMGIGILKMALPYISDGLRGMMTDSVQKWDAYAKTTPYDWDNTVVDAIQTLLHIPDADLPEPAAPAELGVLGQ